MFTGRFSKLDSLHVSEGLSTRTHPTKKLQSCSRSLIKSTVCPRTKVVLHNQYHLGNKHSAEALSPRPYLKGD